MPLFRKSLLQITGPVEHLAKLGHLLSIFLCDVYGNGILPLFIHVSPDDSVPAAICVWVLVLLTSGKAFCGATQAPETKPLAQMMDAATSCMNLR